MRNGPYTTPAMKAAATAYAAKFNARSELTKRICSRVYGEKADILPLWEIVEEETAALRNSHAALVAENAALKDMLIQFSSEDSQVHVEAFRRLKQTARSFLHAAKEGSK